MQILYGLNGTGNGHLCRAVEVIGRLKRRGHEVRVLVSGGSPHFALEALEPYVVYRGFTFATARGKVQYLKTAFKVNLRRFYRDLWSFDASGIDLVITDYEPLSARIARRHGIPSIGISHQYAFSYDVPTARGNPVARFLLRQYAPVDHPIGLHWHHFGYPILPPIVPADLRNRGRSEDRKILVYLPWEDMERMRRELRCVTTHEFHIYDSRHRQASEDANLKYRPPSRQGFLDDLAECGGVFCNAGFELPSEALHLGKKLLVKPLRGQIEQESNALALSQLKLGKATQSLSAEAIREWLDSRSAPPAEYSDVAGAIVRWIERRRWDDRASLARSLWSREARSAA